MHTEVLSVADVDDRLDGPEARQLDQSIGTRDREMYSQIAPHTRAVDPMVEVEMCGISFVQLSQDQELAVSPLDRARDVLFEDAGQIAALSQSVFIGAIVRFVAEEVDPAPDDDDHDHAQIGRGLCEGAGPFEHAGTLTIADYPPPPGVGTVFLRRI